MPQSAQRWIVDTADYRQAHGEALKSMRALPEPLPGLLSTPEAYALSDDYRNATPRILVYGQETRHNTQPLRTCEPFEAWATQVGGAIAFDYARDLKRFSPFWAAFDEIAAAFKVPSRRALGWANIMKVQLTTERNSSFSISRLSDQQQIAIAQAQRELFRAELKFFAPDAILFLTGGLHWIAKYMFEDHHEREQYGFTVVTAADCSLPMAMTYHPAARIAGLKEKRSKAINYLQQQLALADATQPARDTSVKT